VRPSSCAPRLNDQLIRRVGADAAPAPEEAVPSRGMVRPVGSQPQPQPQPPSQSQHAPIAPPPATYVSQPYPYPPAHSAPWHDASGIPPQATHLQHVMPQPTRHPNQMWQPPPSHYPPLEAPNTSATDYPDYARYRPEQDWAPGEYYQEQVCPPSSTVFVINL
jgi:hypothetical protein